MKNSFSSILLAPLLTNVSCNSQKRSTGDQITVNYQIQSSYIVIPVEENAPEIKINVSASNSTIQSTFVCTQHGAMPESLLSRVKKIILSKEKIQTGRI